MVMTKTSLGTWISRCWNKQNRSPFIHEKIENIWFSPVILSITWDLVRTCQNVRSVNPQVTDSETLWVEHRNPYFKWLVKKFWCMLKCENHWFSLIVFYWWRNEVPGKRMLLLSSKNRQESRSSDLCSILSIFYTTTPKILYLHGAHKVC